MRNDISDNAWWLIVAMVMFALVLSAGAMVERAISQAALDAVESEVME